MLRISIICPRAYPLFNPAVHEDFGGAEVQLFLISKQLALDPNFRVQMMVADYGQQAEETREGVVLHRTFRFSDNVVRQILVFLQMLFKVQSDVYIQRTLSPFSALIAILAHFRGARFLYMIAHDMELDGSHPLLKTFLGRWSLRLLFSRANHLIVQSRYQQDLLNRIGIRSTLLPSIYPAKVARSEKTADVLWVGRCESWKRPELYLDLARTCPRRSFVMICPPAVADPGLFKTIESEASTIMNLKFERYVPFDKIDRYFEQTRVFVNTSLYEGFPNTFLQALAVGIPILSMDVDPDRMISSSGFGRVAHGSLSRLASDLDDYLDDPAMREHAESSAFEYIRRRHSPENGAVLLKSIILSSH